MPTFFHKTGREVRRVRRENSQRPGPLPLGKAQQKPRKQQEPSGLPEGSLPPIWNLRQLRRAKNRQIIQCVGGFLVGHPTADSGNPGKADEVPKRNGRYFVESDEKQNRCNRMVEPAGNHARGTKTTDGRTGPAGKIFLPFWGVRWKVGRKTERFSREKTGRNRTEQREIPQSVPKGVTAGAWENLQEELYEKIRDRRRRPSSGSRGRTHGGGPGSRREFPAI